MQIGDVRSDVSLPSFSKRAYRSPTNGQPVNLLRFQIDSLEVGQSFSVTATEQDNMEKIRCRISSSRTQVMKKKKCKFILRKTDERTFTIWRLE